MQTSKHPLFDELVNRATACQLLVECGMDGSTQCEVAVVAEAPGSREVQLGTPLIGGSGKLLWNTLRPHGITRKDCYVTNVCKRQIALEDGKRKPLSNTESEQWKALLRWELCQLPNLKYVLISGGIALEALTGLTGVTQRRGSVLPITLDNGHQIHGVVTLNPAAVLRDLKQEVAFRLDCAKLYRVMNGLHKFQAIRERINPTVDEALAWIAKMKRERKPISFDIETIANETACVGLANSGTEGMCINFRTRNADRYSVDDEMRIRRALQDLFDDPNARFIAQNASFDSYWLWYKDKLRVRRVWFDTMLAHHTLYPGLPHNLGFLCTQYTDYPFYKDEAKQWREGGDIDSFWKYNVHDCCVTWQVAEKLEKELKDQALDKFFFENVMPLQPSLVRMTVGGVLTDQSLRAQLQDDISAEVAKRLEDFRAAVEKATGDAEYAAKVNPRSSKQLSDLLFTRLGLIGRGASTDEENRKAIYNHPRTPENARTILRAIDAYAEEHKFLSTYVDSEIDPDGRIRCDYRQAGVQKAPGRLSSSKTLWGSGMNLQNQPPRARSMFIADPGYCFVYFDLSQAEARVVGWLANIPKWKEQFEKARKDGKYDCHRALAAEMWGMPYESVPKEDFLPDAAGLPRPTRRFIAKRCRHGLNYRMGPERLSQVTGLDRQEAYAAYQAYHRTTPELRRWWAELEKEAREKKMLFNAYGRRLILLERFGDEALESVVAFKPQSTIGDKVCRVIRQCENDVRWPKDARIALNVHDALIALAPLTNWKRVAQLMVHYAEEPLLLNGEQLIIPADIGLSQADETGLHRWSTIKKIDRGAIL